jgi:hypothetical protein
VVQAGQSLSGQLSQRIAVNLGVAVDYGVRDIARDRQVVLRTILHLADTRHTTRFENLLHIKPVSYIHPTS